MTDFELFLISQFAKNLSYRFCFTLLNQNQFPIPEILRWGHKGRF